ncbi:MAG: hypothetical protein ABI680_03655 [Chthoniobacteraceae bacterium]
MKSIIASIFSLCVGVVIGWYFGNTRPVTAANRDARDYLAAVETSDGLTVAHCGRALTQLEGGQLDLAKQTLANPLRDYYHVFGPPDASDKTISAERLENLKFIEKTAAKSPTLQKALAMKE